MHTPDNHPTPATLAALAPLGRLTADELALLSQGLVVHTAAVGDTLVDLGGTEDCALYLLEGQVRLSAADGRRHVITAGTPAAAQPLSHLVPHKYRINAITAVRYLRVSNHILDNLVARAVHGLADSLDLNSEALDNPVFHDIYQALIEDTLVIPTLPDVALRIQCLQDHHTLHDVARILQTDPAIASAVLRVANSALYFRGNGAQTLEQAVQRIGITATQHLVMAYAVRDMFSSTSPVLKQRMARLWKHSTEVAAVAFVLARHHGGFMPEYALALGLLHDIGMLPILTYSERYPELLYDPTRLDDTLAQLHGEIGGLIMTRWNFGDEFAKVARGADDWRRDPAPEADYCDVVLVAQLHSFIGKSQERDLPPMTDKVLPPLPDVPAFRKLGFTDLAPDRTLQLLHEAHEELAQARRLLME